MWYPCTASCTYGEDFHPGPVTNYLSDRLQLFVATWADSLQLSIEAECRSDAQTRCHQVQRDKAGVSEANSIPALYLVITL